VRSEESIPSKSTRLRVPRSPTHDSLAHDHGVVLLHQERDLPVGNGHGHPLKQDPLRALRRDAPPGGETRSSRLVTQRGDLQVKRSGSS